MIINNSLLFIINIYTNSPVPSIICAILAQEVALSSLFVLMCRDFFFNSIFFDVSVCLCVCVFEKNVIRYYFKEKKGGGKEKKKKKVIKNSHFHSRSPCLLFSLSSFFLFWLIFFF